MTGQAAEEAPDYQLLYEATLRNIERMAREPARVRMPVEIRRLNAGRGEVLWLDGTPPA